MKKAQQEREDRKPHGKVRVERIKFITTDQRPHKRKELSNIGACTSKGAKVPLEKPTIGARIKVKPQEEWRYGFHFPDPSIMDEEEVVPKTKDRYGHWRYIRSRSYSIALNFVTVSMRRRRRRPPSIGD